MKIQKKNIKDIVRSKYDKIANQLEKGIYSITLSAKK